MSKLNIKFLALLSALMSCTPALGAMKNGGDIKNKKLSSVYTLIKKPTGSTCYFLKEEITTFGKPELDVFALCCALNLSFCSEAKDCPELDVEHLGVKINDFFGELCKLEFFADPGIKIKWRGDFNLLNCQAIDNETIEIKVKDQNENTYVIVGKLKLSVFGEYWHFYVKDLNTRENHIAESLVDFKANYDKNNTYLYCENLDEFKQKFRRHMLENIVRFLTCNKSFAEVKQILNGRKRLIVDAYHGRLQFSFGTPVSLRLNKNSEKSLEIEFDGCSVNRNCDLRDLTMILYRDNDQAFWDPRIASLSPHTEDKRIRDFTIEI